MRSDLIFLYKVYQITLSGSKYKKVLDDSTNEGQKAFENWTECDLISKIQVSKRVLTSEEIKGDLDTDDNSHLKMEQMEVWSLRSHE